MLIYSFVFLLAGAGLFFNVNKSRTRKKTYLVVLFSCLLLVGICRNPTVGTDMRTFYNPYYPAFADVSWSNVQHVTSSEHWELGYCLYCKFLCMFSTDPQFFIFVTSIVTIVPFAFFIYKNSPDVVFSSFFYIGFHIYTMLLSPARQALAIAILVGIGYEQLKKKNYVVYVLIVYIAYLFHSSVLCALLLIIFDFLPYKKTTIIWLTCSLLGFGFAYTKIIPYLITQMGLTKTYGIYTVGKSHAKGYITIHTLTCFFIPLMIFIVFIFYMNFDDNYIPSNSIYYKTCVRKRKNVIVVQRRYVIPEWKSSFLAYAVFLVVIFRFSAFFINVMSRMAYYFMPFIMIAYPFVRNYIKLENNRKNIDRLVYGSITCFYFYILIFRAKSLWGILPYKTFF